MENYVLTLTRNVQGGMEIYVETYDGSLEQLHRVTKSNCVMIYDAYTYLHLVCPQYGPLGQVLVVCDDDGKMKSRPITLPILNEDLKIVDVFVGDIAFIARADDYGNDRGLTRREAEDLAEALGYYVSVFDGLPKIERVTWV